jgi:hypothetical protein
LLAYVKTLAHPVSLCQGWGLACVLADYKTDAVDGNLEALVETYRACLLGGDHGGGGGEGRAFFVGVGEWVELW